MQPLMKVTDTNNGINFILDFIIVYLSLCKATPSAPLIAMSPCTFTLQLIDKNLTGISPKKFIPTAGY
ncbi:hypothetical protein ACNKHM_23415 [Shigella sonnei]